MGIRADSPTQARAALDAARAERWRRLAPPTVVARAGRPTRVLVRVPASAPLRADLTLEDGGERPLPAGGPVEAAVLDGATWHAVALDLPADLPTGYHRLAVAAGDAHADVTVVAAPRRLPLPPGITPGWGWAVQLYAVRSTASWGIGELADLRDLGAWSARELGASFVLCNPLHAAAPGLPQQPSPYYPSSRRFTNPLYLRVEDVAEFDALDGAAREHVADLAARARAMNRQDRIDRDAVYLLKMEALEAIYAAGRSAARDAAFASFRGREGSGLRDFAVFCALAERHGVPFQRWPHDLRHPAAPQVDVARRRLGDRIDFHAWLQWCCDEQLARAQRAAVDAGMALGLVHDLAVGVDPGGADGWALRDELAEDMTIGAPPDSFNQQGQDWRLPPFRPDRLRHTGYGPFRALLGSLLRHGGGIRIDHVLGLFRLWWIPDGADPRHGTYVRYPADELLAVVAVEADRAGALVIGEDLGTVESGLRDTMADWGLLGSRVLYFERADDGEAPLPAAAYPRLALTTVTTHDLPTAAGWWEDAEILEQGQLGLLAEDTTLKRELERKAAQRRAMLDLLRAEGLVGDDPRSEDLVEAMHAFIASTPSLVVAGSLGDAIGDRRQPNLPGTVDEYPNWRLPIAAPSVAPGEAPQPVVLEDLLERDDVRRLAAALTRRRR
jgi:4-alpha-glucanotransferase